MECLAVTIQYGHPNHNKQTNISFVLYLIYRLIIFQQPIYNVYLPVYIVP